MKRAKIFIALLATVAMLSGFGVSTALAADLTLDLHNDTANVGTDCPDDGAAYWHFVISPNNNNSAFVEFHLNIGGTVYDLGFTSNGGQDDNVFVLVPGGTTLGDLDATGSTADITWNGLGTQPTKFVLSHVCPGDTPGVVTDITTAVHLGTDHTTDIQGTAIALGSTVHDSATVTSTPTGEVIPAGSSITFSFFKNGDCADTAFASQTVSDATVVGQTTTFSVDNGLPEGPLGPGSYSYMAVFASGDTNVVLDAVGDCEPFDVNKGDLTLVTNVHDATHTDVTGSSVALGSIIHDTATLGGAVTGFIPDVTKLSFTFYSAKDCDGTGVAAAQSGTEGSAVRTVDSSPLGAGDYGYVATFAGDDNYNPVGPVECEPVHVNKGDLRIRTDIHDAAHVIVTSVAPGSVVHDTATLSGAVAGFPPVLTNVAFTFFTNGTCTGTGASAGPTTTEGTLARSANSAPLASGQYSYSATFTGDPNYNEVGPAACEPLGVRQLGKTMGFWGNTNGQARLVANDAFSAANAVVLGIPGGCTITVDSAAKSKTIFPNTLNGITLTTCGGANGLDTGINTNSFNVLLAQTLAISYNIKYVSLYAGQTVAGLGCTAVAPVTGAWTVEQVRDYANGLIGNAKRSFGTTVTQTQIGNLNTLLGCLNRES